MKGNGLVDAFAWFIVMNRVYGQFVCVYGPPLFMLCLWAFIMFYVFSVHCWLRPHVQISTAQSGTKSDVLGKLPIETHACCVSLDVLQCFDA